MIDRSNFAIGTGRGPSDESIRGIFVLSNWLLLSRTSKIVSGAGTFEFLFNNSMKYSSIFLVPTERRFFTRFSSGESGLFFFSFQMILDG